MILKDGYNQPIAPQAFAETSPLFYEGYFVPRQGLQLETVFAPTRICTGCSHGCPSW